MDVSPQFGVSPTLCQQHAPLWYYLKRWWGVETQHWSQVWNIHLLNDRCSFSDDRIYIPPVSLAPVILVLIDLCWFAQRSGLTLRGTKGEECPAVCISHVATWQGRSHFKCPPTQSERERDCTLGKSDDEATKPRLYLLPAHLPPEMQACYLLFKMSRASVYWLNNSLSLVSHGNLYLSIKHKICTLNKLVRMHKIGIIAIWDQYINS